MLRPPSTRKRQPVQPVNSARPFLNGARQRVAAWLCLGLASLAAAGCATAETCDKALAASPQFSAQDCVFQNLQNPQAKPSQPGWKIWSRFLEPAPPGTTPIDPIPLRKLDRAMLDALDPSANHLIRLGHSSHLLKLRGKLLADRSGVRRTRIAVLVRGSEAVPPAAAAADRAARHRRADPVARPLRPSRRGHHRIRWDSACSATSCRWAWAAAADMGRRARPHRGVRLVAGGPPAATSP